MTHVGKEMYWVHVPGKHDVVLPGAYLPCCFRAAAIGSLRRTATADRAAGATIPVVCGL